MWKQLIQDHTICFAVRYLFAYDVTYYDYNRDPSPIVISLPPGQVGITLDCDWKEPITTRALDRYAADRALSFKLGWFAEPMFGHGDYPTVMRQYIDRRSFEKEHRKESRLPHFTEEEKKLNKG